MAPREEIFTIGHSTHPIERFLELLAGARVEAIADVRRYPGSRRNPQFGAERLRKALGAAGIDYEPFAEELGGRRSTRDAVTGEEAEISGWRVAAFRAYAGYMGEPGFATGLERLERLARERRTAVMCAEAHPSRCHRRLIADALLVAGWSVTHLLSDGRAEPHELSPPAAVAGGRLLYPAQPGLGP